MQTLTTHSNYLLTQFTQGAILPQAVIRWKDRGYARDTRKILDAQRNCRPFQRLGGDGATVRQNQATPGHPLRGQCTHSRRGVEGIYREAKQQQPEQKIDEGSPPRFIVQKVVRPSREMFARRKRDGPSSARHLICSNLTVCLATCQEQRWLRCAGKNTSMDTNNVSSSIFAVGKHITWLADVLTTEKGIVGYYAAGTITHLTNDYVTIQYDADRDDPLMRNPMPKWYLAERVSDSDLRTAIKNSRRPYIAPDGNYHDYSITDPRTRYVRYVGMTNHVEHRMQQHERLKRGCNLSRSGVSPRKHTPQHIFCRKHGGSAK